jgi:hypothetical protein
MCLDLIVAVVVLANLGIAGFFVFSLHRSKSRRTRPLWKFVTAYGVISTVLVVPFYLLSNPRPSLLGLSAGTFYLLIGSFVLTIEVPGYLFLRRRDQSVLDFLEDWRTEMVKVGYDFGNYSTLKSKSEEGKATLEEVGIYRVVIDFIDHSGRIQNVDKGLWALTLGEVNRAIDAVQARSKHPAPELIEILSLSGLSFLIAQILRLVG